MHAHAHTKSIVCTHTVAKILQVPSQMKLPLLSSFVWGFDVIGITYGKNKPVNKCKTRSSFTGTKNE